MAKKLNEVQVNLAFTADTGKAKAQLKDLQNQLSSLMNLPSSQLPAGLSAEQIKASSRAAAELKIHLQNATNVNTGNLDFTKLNQSIQKSGTSLSQYAKQLQAIGPEGQRAFLSLTQAVMKAEIPIRRSNEHINELWTTMKNTARWQLTSSMLHGFMGAMQKAVGYAEDLNESLNNIRIVTGKSVDQMADFAKEANKAAKSLSTSTTNYTNAALIYYQQGLNEQQVKERTDLTIQMANVSRQSAEEVSDQLTAIWNNFYDGSQSLEHYADVMVRLGADTASSSDEIAQGLEKFAAIGDMIGLSFDNAAAALATVTSETRQSADVVGTAFKTIFARIQGLSFGETLDDGTNLNKYSEALMKVGISIKDQQGNLKDMDTILAEMGERWGSLSKDQQTALAQTVAGVRQYNQLVALMENYDKYQTNLLSAQTSDGSLGEQARIYEESWEAASKRVQASLEDIWDTLINDEVVVKVLNGVEDIINLVDKLIDSMGGLSGLLPLVGAIFIKTFSSQIQNTLMDASNSLMTWTESGRKKLQEEKMAQASALLKNANISDTQRDILKAQLKSYQDLTDKAGELTEFEKQRYQLLLDQQKAQGDYALQKKKEWEQAQEDVKDATLYAKVAFQDEENEAEGLTFGKYQEHIKELEDAKIAFERGDDNSESRYSQALVDIAKFEKRIKANKKEIISYKEAILNVTATEKEFTRAFNKATEDIEKNTQATSENTDEKNKNTQAENQNKKAVEKTTQEIDEQTAAMQRYEKRKQQIGNFASATAGLLSFVGGLSSLKSALNTLESDMDPLDKLTSVGMSLTMAVPQLRNGLEALNQITVGSNVSLGKFLETSGGAGKILSKLGVSAKGSAMALGSIALYAAIAAAAIFTTVAIVKQAIDAYNDHKIAVQDATKQVEECKTAYEDATTAFENLKSSITDYQGMQDALSKLTAGTKEWKEALTESNNKVLEMLRTYPELAEYFENNNGVFSFSNIDAVEDIYAKRRLTAQGNLNTSQIVLNQAQNRSARTDLSRTIENDLVHSGPYNSSDITSAFDKLQNSYDSSGSLVFTDFSEFSKTLVGTNDSVIQALWNNKEALEELTKTTHLNNIQTQALVEANFEAINADNKLVANMDEDEKSLAAAISAKRAGAIDTNDPEYIKTREKWEKEIFNGLGIDNYDAYLKSRYGDDAKNYKVVDRGGDDATLKHYNSETGTWETVGDKQGLSNTTILDWMTQQDLQKFNESDQATLSQLDIINKTLSQVKGITSEQILKIQKDALNGAVSLVELTPEQKDQFEDIWELAAKDSVNSYTQAIEVGLKSYSKEDYWNNVIRTGIESINILFANTAEELGMTDEALESYAGSLIEGSKYLDQFKDNALKNAAANVELMQVYAKVAVAQVKLAKGFNEVQDTFEKYRDVIKEGDKSTLEYNEAVGELTVSLEKAFGLEIDSNTIKENMDTVQKAVEGNVEAFNELRTIINKDFIAKLQLDDSGLNEALANELESLQAEALEYGIDAELNLNNEKAIQAINKALITGEATISDIEAMFNNANLAMPEYNTVTIPGDAVHSSSTVSGTIMGIPYTATSDTTTTTDRVVPYFGDNEPTVNKETKKIDSYGGLKSGSSMKVQSLGNTSEIDKLIDYSGTDSSGKKSKSEADRYHEENDAIDKQQKLINKLSKEKDRLYGANRLKAINDEIKAYEQMAIIQKDLLNEQIREKQEKQKELYEIFGKISYGENGDILNFESLMKSAINDYQVDLLNSYHDLNNEIENTKENINDVYDTVQDLNFEEFNYKLELKLDLKESELKKLDYTLKKYEKNFYKLAEVMSLVAKKSTPHEDAFVTDLEASLVDLETRKANNKISDADYIAGLQAIQDQAYDSANALYDLNEEMLSYYEDALSKGADLFAEYTQEFDGLLDTLDHYSNVLSLIGKDKDYETMNSILQGRIDILNDKVSASKAMLESYDSEIARIEENIKNAATDKDKEYWQQQLRTINQMKAEEQSALYSYLEEIGDSANQILENNITKAFDNAEKAITGGMSFDTIISDMERINTLQDEYLTTTNKMYETNKLISKAQQALDKSSNSAAKQKYKDYIAYIEKLQVSGNLSEHELKIAQAHYQILEAEMALEDAKNAKSTVRLHRDSEGNFGYVYTADQDKIQSSTENYLESQNNLYNIGLDGTKEYQEKIIQLEKDTLAELEQLEIDYRVNHLISEEEYNRQKASIEETSQELLKSYQQSYNLSQYTMATTSYSELMREDNLFRQGQLSANASNYDLLKYNDAQYYGGLQSTAQATQAQLTADLATLGTTVLEQEDINYKTWGEADTGYYTGLELLAKNTADSLNGIYNTNPDSATNNLNKFYENLDDALDKCEEATSTWQTNMKPLVDSVGLSFDDPSTQGLKQKIEAAKTASSNLKTELTKTGGLVDGIEDLWEEVNTATTAWQDHWNELDLVIARYDALIKRIDTLRQKEAEDKTETPSPPPPSILGTSLHEDMDYSVFEGSDQFGEQTSTRQISNTNGNSLKWEVDPNEGGDGQSKDDESSSGMLAIGNRVKVANNDNLDYLPAYHKNSNGKLFWNSYTNRDKIAGKTITGAMFYDGQMYYELSDTEDLFGYSSWYKSDHLQKYNTGGYTGAWGPEGRLAVLHEKEIVLNKDDTSNLLKTVEFMHQLISMIDGQAAMASLFNMSAIGGINSHTNTLDQTVTIHAEFPNATDHNEIEEAFKNLINTASQYANRK